MPSLMKDRYRPVFCEPNFYLRNQNLFSEWLELFKDFTPVEKIQGWVVALSLLRRPDDWFGGFRKVAVIHEDFDHPLRLNELNFKIPSKLKSDMNLFTLINHVYIKPLPDPCLRSLVRVTNQSYPLEIVHHVPSPRELLSYQLRGKRIISYNQDFKTWPSTLYHGRDFLSFIIHDFHRPKTMRGSLAFTGALI